MCNRITLEIELRDLQEYHKKLDESIARGYTNYISDTSLTKMKQEKLMVKRRIVELEQQLSNPTLDILR